MEPAKTANRLGRAGTASRAEDALQHGTRTCYQKGCRCLPCTAANAYYVAKWRLDKAKGKQRLGAKVNARVTQKQIQALRLEGLTYGEIAIRLGLKWPRLRLHTDCITVRNYLKIRRLYRQLMAEPPMSDAQVQPHA